MPDIRHDPPAENGRPDPSTLNYEETATAHVSMRRVLALFAPHRLRLTALLALMAAATLVGMLSPFLLRAVIDEALPAKDLRLLAMLTLGMVVIAMVSAALSAWQVVLSTAVGQAVMHDLRVRVYAHLRTLSLRFFTHHRTGDVQSRIVNDIAGLQSVVTSAADEFGRALVTVVMTSAAILLLDWRLGLLILAVVPLTVVISHHVAKRREALMFEQQQCTGALSSMVQETLSVPGVILTRTLNTGSTLVERFTGLSLELARLGQSAHTAGEWQWAIINLALAVVPALTLLLGGWLMQDASSLTIGTLVALIALQEQLVWPFEQLLQIGREMRTTRALFTRVFECLDERADIRECAEPVTIERSKRKGAVRIDRVSFSYDHVKRPTLRDVSVDIAPGKHLAIVGATGSGKTTLGQLIARLYDVDSGAILLDEVDVRALSLRSLAEMVGVVPQDTYLLHGSVSDNLRLALPGASDAQLVQATSKAQLHAAILRLPRGYDTVVGDGGHSLSGGEKQRLALARTLLRDPAVLLLDEATSALDASTEALVVDALGELAGHRTVITIAHRMTTARRADRILVLDEGRIVEDGTHDALMALDGHYARLVRA